MKSQRWMSQIFFLFFFTWGVFLPYWTGWLVDGKGLTVPEASIIMGAGLFVRGISTLFIYPASSKYWSQKTVFFIFTVLSFLVALLYIPSATFILLLLVTIFFSAVYPTLLPGAESMAGTLIQHEGLNYGRSRSYGSLGFILSAFVISFLAGYIGVQSIFVTMVAGLTLLVFICFLPAPEILLKKPSRKEQNASFSMRSLLNVKSFPIVLLIVILINGSHASIYNYGFLYVQHLGVNVFVIGLILNIAVISEIILFATADKLFKGWKSSSLLMIGTVGATLRWILIFLFPNIWVFMISQTLHALSFGLSHYAFIRYITEKLQQEQIPNAQGLYSALAMSFSTAVLTFPLGYIYEWNEKVAFLAMVVCTVPAIFIILATKKRFQY